MHLGSPGRLNPGLAGYIGEALRQRGVQIAVLSCYINLIHPDPRERRKQIELFKEHLRFVRDFGCGIVATETGSLNPDWAGLEEMVAEAERFGVLVGVGAKGG